MREGEGSISGTSELTKSLKVDVFVSLCDNSAHKRAGKDRKFSELLTIIWQVWGKNKICKSFSKQGGTKQYLGFTLGSSLETISKVLLVSRPLPMKCITTHKKLRKSGVL